MMNEEPYGEGGEDFLIIDNHKPLSIVQQLVPKEDNSPPQPSASAEQTAASNRTSSSSYLNPHSPRLNSLSIVTTNNENSEVVAHSSVCRKSSQFNSPTNSTALLLQKTSFSSLTDDFKIMYRVFTNLDHVDLIRVGNACSFWRRILRECATLSKQKENLSGGGANYLDLYERECKRLWPSNHDVSRYPLERPLTLSSNNDDNDEEVDNKRRVSVLELDSGGYRGMILDRNRENELYPIVYLDFSKTSRRCYLNNKGDDSSNDQFETIGRIEIKLNKKEAPKAAENFRCLCTGEKGLSPNSIPLYFKGATMHKAFQATLIQGGDIVYSGASGWWQAQYGKEIATSTSEPAAIEGEGSESIFGHTFEGDVSTLSHNTGSVSCIARNGSNGCQFTICVAKCKELDGKQTVFGEVVKGQEVLRKIESAILLSQQAQSEDQEVVFVSSCNQIGFTGKTFEQWTHTIMSATSMQQSKTETRNEPVKSRACQIL